MFKKYYSYTITDQAGVVINGGVATVWVFRSPSSVHKQIVEFLNDKYGKGNFTLTGFVRVY